MATTNSSASAPVNVSTPSGPQRNERPFIGDGAPKFVIKLTTPIPS